MSIYYISLPYHCGDTTLLMSDIKGFQKQLLIFLILFNLRIFTISENFTVSLQNQRVCAYLTILFKHNKCSTTSKTYQVNSDVNQILVTRTTNFKLEQMFIYNFTIKLNKESIIVLVKCKFWCIFNSPFKTIKMFLLRKYIKHNNRNKRRPKFCIVCILNKAQKQIFVTVGFSLTAF